MKFKSSRLKEFEYNINQTFNEAKENGEMVALADNQILRSIRDITGKKINKKHLEKWFYLRDKLKKRKNSKKNIDKIKRIQNKINNMMFIPEYITIVIEHPAHYDYLFANGLVLNSKKYIRFSCSASQGRVSTVVFCEEKIAQKLLIILNNDRNLDKKLVPSKFNAYFGLSGSATFEVSTPRFCVVADYKDSINIKVNFVTETDWEEDDIIEVKNIVREFNRFDGQGLISFEKAKEWADELGLDYVPAQWCVRQNYIKGMLCTFPFHKFCETENDNNYLVKSVYNDELVDLRNIDVILSEGMFKLWDSFNSLNAYEQNCKKNNLKWGIVLHSPKETKDILRMNYQFIQTLNLNQKDIENICKKFVDWIDGVNSDNIYYTLLFLLGKNNTEEKINGFLKNSNLYWIKSLIVNHNLLGDRYIKKKIYDLIKNKIKRACLSEILVDGNFQTLVSDPYAMMQAICGQKVTGLLKEREYYSAYWNKKNVKTIDSMRAPLTYRSEHLKLNLVDNEKLRDWYRYCYEGIIVNVFGMETLHWAGSDFDYDQIATTSNCNILKGIYENELPVVYTPLNANPDIITSYNLYQADLFAFGSIIGSITNKSTSAYALLPTLEEDSLEYEVTMNRLKMCTKLQSAQIDKAKIGKNVKGIPQRWTKFQKIRNNDSEEEKKEKEFYNRILLGRHPYFFIYLYKGTYSKYKKYVASYDLSCRQKFGISLEELLNQKRKTKEEKEFLDLYYKFMPVIDSDSVANSLCKYIESIDFQIKQKIKNEDNNNVWQTYLHPGISHNEETYLLVLKEYKAYNKSIKDMRSIGVYRHPVKERYDKDLGRTIEGRYEEFKRIMNSLCSNVYELVNYLVKIFYVEYPGSNKDLLWNTYGKYIFRNIKRKREEVIKFPFPDSGGDIEYLNKMYSLKEVSID